MKNKKLGLLLYLKTNNLSSKLYVLGFFTYIIPIIIIASLDSPPTFISANLIVTISMSLFILGNLLSFLKKDKDDKSRGLNIAYVLGIFTSLLLRYLEKI